MHAITHEAKSSTTCLLEPLTVKSEQGSRLRECLNVALVAGIFVFCVVPTSLPVFLITKMADGPDGFSPVTISSCQSLFWMGAACSVFVMPIVDTWGRHTPAFTLFAMALTAGCSCASLMSAVVYAALQFFLGLTISSATQAAYLIVVESSRDDVRVWLTMALNVTWSLIFVLMALVCDSVTRNLNWRLETVLWYIPGVTLFVFGLLLTSESPQFITSSARRGSWDDVSTLAQVISSPLRGRMVATAVCWVACSLSFYGLSFSIGKLSSDLYTNATLMGFMDTMGYLVAGFAVERLGSSMTQILSFGGAAVSLGACAFLHPGSTAVLVCAVIGRLLIDIAFTTVYLLLVDHFPAECRATAGGIANCFARLSSMLAPFCALVPSSVSCPFFGLLCLSAAVATTCLPQTMRYGEESDVSSSSCLYHHTI